MIVEYRYSRQYKPHAEYHVKGMLELLYPGLPGEYTLKSSTAAIFTMVRAWCYLNKLPLKAYYEDELLPLDDNMGVSDWSKYPDFNINEDALKVLLTHNNPTELEAIRKRVEGYL